jgi:Amidohydrolase
VSLLVRFTSDNALAPLQLAFAGVFDRFPTLRVYWAETQVGWLPYCLSQIDDNYERNRHWATRQWGMEPLKHRPSEYLCEYNLWGFMKDSLGVRLRHDVGVKALIWGSDFAHATGDWPESRRTIDETFVAVPDDERYAMLAGNAIEFFQLKDTVPDVNDLAQAATGT